MVTIAPHPADPLLCTPEGVQNYLHSHRSLIELQNFDDKDCKPVVDVVAGGLMNHTFRVTLKHNKQEKTARSKSQTFIVKYSAPTVACNPSCRLTTERSYYEYAALHHLHRFRHHFSPDYPVRTPEVVHYDHKDNLMVITDAGANSTTLKDYIKANPNSPTNLTIARALGTWLARFHLWGASEDARELRSILSQNVEMARDKLDYAFGSLEPKADPLWTELRGHVQNLQRNLNFDDEENLPFIVHGDFWTGNILVSSKHIKDTAPDLTVIDWEGANCYGFAWTDIGQMCAELYELAVFGYVNIGFGKKLITSFLQGYLSHRKLSKEEVRMTAVRFGVHLFVWPSVTGWRGKEAIIRCKKLGREYIKHGWACNQDWLRQSVLGALVHDEFDKPYRLK